MHRRSRTPKSVGRKPALTVPDFTPRSLDALIAELAGGQFAMVSTEQMVALGIGERAVRKRCTEGKLHRVHDGVYAVGHPFVTQRGRWMAAVLACGPGAMLSHGSCAALRDLRRYDSGMTDITVSQRSRRRRAGIRVHRPRHIADADRDEVEGIPCTSVPRTLLDLGEVLEDRALERVCDEAELLRVLDVRAVNELLSRAGGHRGAHRLRRVLAIHDAGSTPTRNELEESFLALSDGAGLPRPAVNAWVPLPIPAGGIEVDFLWRAERLVVEVDGGAVHSRRRTLERDYDKNLLLDAAGFTVKRFTWRQVTQNGPEVIAAVTRHLQDAWGENRHS